MPTSDPPASKVAAVASPEADAGTLPVRAVGIRGVLALAALCLVFIAMAAVDLDNVRPVSGDDALILTVSAHLAETGTLGSPLYDGVFGADDHYFLNLPLQHLLHALVFRTIGEGVAEARAVSLVAALVILSATTLLALRWFGARVAIGTALLFVVWRSGVIGLDYGLPLLAVARTARYDVTAIAFLWLALLTFDVHRRRPKAVWAFTTGLLAAAAILTQFHGALVLPALAALWWANRGAIRTADVRWLALGLVLGLAPYAAWFAPHASDALGQIRLVHDARIADGPSGLLRSVLTESLRFSAAATQRGIGQLGLLLALAAAPLLTRRNPPNSRANDASPDNVRALLFVSGSMLLGLALFEPTKAPLYALPLVPALCILLALALDALWRRGRTGEGVSSRATLVAVLAIVAALTAEGTFALVRDRVAAARVTPYAELAAEIDGEMEAAAALLGPAQWSWGLQAHPYEEFRALALRQQALDATGDSVPPLDAMLRERRVRHVLINDDVRNDLRAGFYGVPFGTALTRYIAACTSAVRVWREDTYGAIELRRVRASCSE